MIPMIPMVPMMPMKRSRRAARALRDFLAGLVLFVTIAAAGVGERTPAGTSWLAGAAHAQRLIEIEAPADPSLQPFLVSSVRAAPMADGRRQLPALVSLAVAFSMLIALNMWFARHVRRVHAAARRRRR